MKHTVRINLCKIISLAFFISFKCYSAEPETQVPVVPTITVPRVEIGPGIKIDGKLDEKEWKSAVLIKGFKTLGKAPKDALEQTEVKLMYDVDAIYLGFICHESKMDSIVPGLPKGQTVDTPINSNGDCGELLIDTDGDPSQYYHLRFNPRGGIHDQFVINTIKDTGIVTGFIKGNDRWNGKWKVATTTDKTKWIAEIRIDLSSFSKEGKFGGTPVPGTEWRVNFCRAEAPHGEFSAWSPPNPGLFHIPSYFGKLIFGGWRFGEIILKDVEPGKMRLGENTFKATVKNLAKKKADIGIKATITEDERDIDEMNKKIKKRSWLIPKKTIPLFDESISLKPGEEKIISFPYTLSYGGQKSIGIHLSWKRMITRMFSGWVQKNVYPLFQKITEIETGIENLKKEFNALEPTPSSPQVNSFVKELTDIEKLLQGLKDNQTTPWGKRKQTCESLENKLKSLRRTYVNHIYPDWMMVKQGIKKPGFCVGIEHPTVKVFRDEIFTGKFSDTAHISMAANEYESAQFVLIPLKDDVGKINFKVSNLINTAKPKYMIKSLFCSFDTVGYIDVGDTGRGTKVGAWPDVLYPQKYAVLKNNLLQPVMLTIKTPSYTQPGTYKGTVTFSNDKYPSVTINLEVKVFPFVLPDIKSMRNYIWFWTHRPRMTYGSPWMNFRKDFFPLDFFKSFAETQGKYHINTCPEGEIVFRKLKLIRRKNGTIEFDFSDVDPYWEIAIKNGTNVLTINALGPNFFKKPKKSYHLHAVLYDEATGKIEDPFVAENPEAMADQYLKAVCDHLKKKGWFKFGVFRSGDEPWGAKAQERMRKTYKKIKSIAPELPITAAGTIRKRMNLDGHLDIWCPQFRQYEPEDYQDMDRKKEGLWLYQCLYKPLYPMFQIDRPAIEPRMAYWLCWKVGADGFIYWSSTAWDSPRINNEKYGGNHGMNRWIHEKWLFPMKNMPGDGCFIYPQPHRVVASLRAQSIRDGVEDYEYFAILKKLYEQKKGKKGMTPELAAKVEACLKLPDNIVKSMTKWTKSVQDLEGMRNEVANLIIQLKKIRR